MVGVAAYTGKDTRIQRNNARLAPFKAGAYDKFLNTQVVALCFIQVVLCVALAVASWVWRRDHESHERHWYFSWQHKATGKVGNNAGNDLVFGIISFLTVWCVPVLIINGFGLGAGRQMMKKHMSERSAGGEIPPRVRLLTKPVNLVN